MSDTAGMPSAHPPLGALLGTDPGSNPGPDLGSGLGAGLGPDLAAKLARAVVVLALNDRAVAAGHDPPAAAERRRPHLAAGLSLPGRGASGVVLVRLGPHPRRPDELSPAVVLEEL